MTTLPLLAAIRRRFALPLLAALAAGCSAYGVAPPDVSLVNISFDDLSLFETTGTITVRVTNENPDPLVIDGASFKLVLDGVTVGKALSDRRYEIPRLASATDDVTIHLSNVALATRLRPVLDRERVEWAIQARLWVVGSLGTRRMNVTREGILHLGAERAAEPPAVPPLPDGAGSR